MGGQKITELTLNTAPITTDVLPMVDIGTTASQKITIANLLTLFVSNVVVQVLTASGTYTPTAGMKKCLAICVGGGGGGASGTDTDSAGGGGGGGGCAIKLLTAADIGASKAYTIGAAGAAEGAGGSTYIGAAASELVLASGGGAGTAGAASSGTIGTQAAGGDGGVGTVGDLLIRGNPGGRGLIYSGSEGYGGKGGSSFLGAGAPQSLTNTAGTAGAGYGGGGAGGHASAVTNKLGAAGSIGIIYIIEFLG